MSQSKKPDGNLYSSGPLRAGGKLHPDSVTPEATAPRQLEANKMAKPEQKDVAERSAAAAKLLGLTGGEDGDKYFHAPSGAFQFFNFMLPMFGVIACLERVQALGDAYRTDPLYIQEKSSETSRNARTRLKHMFILGIIGSVGMGFCIAGSVHAMGGPLAASTNTGVLNWMDPVLKPVLGVGSWVGPILAFIILLAMAHAARAFGQYAFTVVHYLSQGSLFVKQDEKGEMAQARDEAFYKTGETSLFGIGEPKVRKYEQAPSGDAQYYKAESDSDASDSKADAARKDVEDGSDDRYAPAPSSAAQMNDEEEGGGPAKPLH